MIRRHATLLHVLLMATDAAVALAVLVAVFVFHYGDTAPPANEGSFGNIAAPVVLYVATWVLLLYLVGEYRLRARWTLRSEIAGITRATIWLAVLSFSGLFLWNLTEISRLFLVLLFPIQGAVTIAMRAVLRWAFQVLRERGRNGRFVLVVGTSERAYAFARQIADEPSYGLRIIGFVGDPPSALDSRWPYLGLISETPEILHREVVDEVAICLPRSDASTTTVEEIVQLCQEEGKIVRIPLDAPQLESGLRIIEDLNGTAVLSILQGPDHVLALGIKRIVDVVGSAVALTLLSPVILAAAIYIRLRGGAPVLFTQTRVGMHGREFTIYKFRTMDKDADARYDELAHLSSTRGAAFKMAHDPRITRWGGLLRRTSIDELPQLWNVLKGDMSLVGPRPAPPREVAEYDVWHRRRLSMKPGITGLWQVTSRLDRDFDDRAKLDLDYIDGWSIWLDLRIVAQTVPTVLHLSGH